MLAWIGRFISSSIGKKVVMALTGLALVGFLVVHLAGNLSLYVGGEEALDAYAAELESLGPLLTLAELGLLALLVVHVTVALRVSRENAAARGHAYRVRTPMGGKTPGSATMLISGLVLGVFLVIHLLDFRLPKLTGEIESLGAAVVARLSAPLGAGIYLVGAVALGLHLSHAIHSALHTLGIHHERHTPLLRVLCRVLAVVLTLGFLSFPLYYLLLGRGR